MKAAIQHIKEKTIPVSADQLSVSVPAAPAYALSNPGYDAGPDEHSGDMHKLSLRQREEIRALQQEYTRQGNFLKLSLSQYSHVKFVHTSQENLVMYNRQANLHYLYLALFVVDICSQIFLFIQVQT